MRNTSTSYKLNANTFDLPNAIYDAPGLTIGSHDVQSILLSTNLSYIANLDIDAVLIVHPFDPTQEVNEAIHRFCEGPTFLGIGGGYRQKENMLALAEKADQQNADGVVISRPTSPELIRKVSQRINTKLIYTVMYEEENYGGFIEAGVDILNITTGESTPQTIRNIREYHPDIPIMANGGPFDSTIRETIASGADAIVYNPPTATEMIRVIFDEFRNAVSNLEH
ncbi:MAG: hydrolase [Bacteroidota bacterium]